MQNFREGDTSAYVLPDALTLAGLDTLQLGQSWKIKTRIKIRHERNAGGAITKFVNCT